MQTAAPARDQLRPPCGAIASQAQGPQLALNGGGSNRERTVPVITDRVVKENDGAVDSRRGEAPLLGASKLIRGAQLPASASERHGAGVRIGVGIALVSGAQPSHHDAGRAGREVL